MVDGEDYYAVLGVARDASQQEIRQQFRKLALTCHPDRGGDAGQFDRINKACEVLSDPKLRDRYDDTGRTQPLSVVEDFRESFFGGRDSGMTVMEERRERERRRAEAEAERRRKEDFQGLRVPPAFFAPDSRRGPPAVEEPRPARGAGAGAGGAAVPPPAAWASEAHAAFKWKQPGAEDEPAPRPSNGVVGGGPPVAEAPQLTLGDRVEFHSIKARPEMNGLRGVLVAFREDRWQVRLDNGLGEKLIKARNLKLVEEDDFSAQTAAPEASVEMLEVPRCCIVGSWNRWDPCDMEWDERQRCCVFHVELGASCFVCFQIWLDGDWTKCLHPDRPDCGHGEGKLCGPDDLGHDRSWAVGCDPRDQAAPGARYQIRLHFNEHGIARRVDWVQTGPGSAAPGVPVNAFLRSVWPAWSDREILGVQERLANLQYVHLNRLLPAVLSSGSGGLGAKLRTGSDRSLTEDMLRAMRKQADELERRQPARGATNESLLAGTPGPAPALAATKASAKGRTAPQQPRAVASSAPGGPATVSRSAGAVAAAVAPIDPGGRSEAAADLGLPTREFEVLHDTVYVRKAPSLDSPAIGQRSKGSRIRCLEETFDGWVKLEGKPGWLLKDMRGLRGLGELLRPAGPPPQLLAASEAADAPGPAEFEVLYSPSVVVRASPSKDAPARALKKCGAVVLAETQTYNGWVRLVNGDGWMLTWHADHGQLLRCRYAAEVEARRRAEDALRSATDALAAACEQDDPQALQAAVAQARAAGVDRAPLEEAEAILAVLRRREAERQQLRRRLEQAAAGQLEPEQVRECLDACATAGFEEEALMAQGLLDKCLEEQDRAAVAHADLLDELARATASGDPAAVKRARDAAKNAGVPKQEIARVYALHSRRGEEAREEAERQRAEAPAAVRELPADALGDASSRPRASAAFPREAGPRIGTPPEVEEERQDTTSNPPAPAPPADVQQPAGPQDEGPFDGYWVNAGGEAMATIRGSTIHWEDGPAQALTQLGDGALTTEMFGQVFNATLDPEGRLLWSDGDIWTRCPGAGGGAAAAGAGGAGDAASAGG